MCAALRESSTTTVGLWPKIFSFEFYFFFFFQGCHTHLTFILKLTLIRLFDPIFTATYCWFRKFKKVFCSKFYHRYYESIQCNFKILETHKLYKPAFTYSKAIMEGQEQGVKSGEI